MVALFDSAGASLTGCVCWGFAMFVRVRNSGERRLERGRACSGLCRARARETNVGAARTAGTTRQLNYYYCLPVVCVACAVVPRARRRSGQRVDRPLLRMRLEDRTNDELEALLADAPLNAAVDAELVRQFERDSEALRRAASSTRAGVVRAVTAHGASDDERSEVIPQRRSSRSSSPKNTAVSTTQRAQRDSVSGSGSGGGSSGDDIDTRDTHENADAKPIVASEEGSQSKVVAKKRLRTRSATSSPRVRARNSDSAADVNDNSSERGDDKRQPAAKANQRSVPPKRRRTQHSGDDESASTRSRPSSKRGRGAGRPPSAGKLIEQELESALPLLDPVEYRQRVCARLSHQQILAQSKVFFVVVVDVDCVQFSCFHGRLILMILCLIYKSSKTNLKKSKKKSIQLGAQATFRVGWQRFLASFCQSTRTAMQCSQLKRSLLQSIVLRCALVQQKLVEPFDADRWTLLFYYY